MKNRTMMQFFEWDLPSNGNHWNKIKSEAKKLASNGITMCWLPPAYKGQAGMNDVGYGVYDLYDLGEFFQKGSIATKYGTKNEYLSMIKELHEMGMEVIVDLVLNHRMGADEIENINATNVYNDNRTYIKEEMKEIGAWTKFTFPGRKGKYSDFIWDHTCFSGIDYDDKEHRNGIYLFEGKKWDETVDNENVNYDYLMGVNLDLNEDKVWLELVKWGKWYYDLTQFDGLRLDAIKHMCTPFYRDYVYILRDYSQRELFTVGEYWSSDLDKLLNYLENTNHEFSLFDVPLHMKFYEISHSNGNYDLSTLFDHTLTKEDSWHSVTFVDNHDTQPGQALCSFVEPWFKEIAYGIILLQEKGIPCVFYGDYYGIEAKNYRVEPTRHLFELISLRNTHAYGKEYDYYDDPSIIGFTREGNEKDHGLALICSIKESGTKTMYVGYEHRNQIYKDILGNNRQEVTIDKEGYGTFYCEAGSISVYTPYRKLHTSYHHQLRKKR